MVWNNANGILIHKSFLTEVECSTFVSYYFFYIVFWRIHAVFIPQFAGHHLIQCKWTNVMLFAPLNSVLYFIVQFIQFFCSLICTRYDCLRKEVFIGFEKKCNTIPRQAESNSQPFLRHYRSSKVNGNEPSVLLLLRNLCPSSSQSSLLRTTAHKSRKLIKTVRVLISFRGLVYEWLLGFLPDASAAFSSWNDTSKTLCQTAVICKTKRSWHQRKQFREAHNRSVSSSDCKQRPIFSRTCEDILDYWICFSVRWN